MIDIPNVVSTWTKQLITGANYILLKNYNTMLTATATVSRNRPRIKTGRLHLKNVENKVVSTSEPKRHEEFHF